MSITLCRIRSLGLVSALGTGIDRTRQSIFGAVDNFVPASQIYPDMSRAHAEKLGLVGAVTDPLVEIPEELANLSSRNGALFLTAYLQISETVEALKAQFGPSRIGVVVGSSTSGIATGEIGRAHV